MAERTMEELLTPYEEFEKENNIKESRNDIPRKFLGICPSKYYKTVNMDVKALSCIVEKLFRKLYRKD